MGAHETNTFMSGDSVALWLPEALAIGPDERMTIKQNGDVLTVRRVHDHDPAEAKRKLAALIADLQAIGRPGEVEVREPIEFPDRPGL